MAVAIYGGGHLRPAIYGMQLPVIPNAVTMRLRLH